MPQQPLADLMRPNKISEFVGQNEIVGKDGILRKLITGAKETGFFPSLIFWGPPGSGKTTLTRIIASTLKREFYEFSAVNTSIKDIEAVIKKLSVPKTENPSFEVISPLLSRSRVIVLKRLEEEGLQKILERALRKIERKITPDALNFLIESSNGDARVALNVVEIADNLTNKKI